MSKSKVSKVKIGGLDFVEVYRIAKTDDSEAYYAYDVEGKHKLEDSCTIDGAAGRYFLRRDAEGNDLMADADGKKDARYTAVIKAVDFAGNAPKAVDKLVESIERLLRVLDRSAWTAEQGQYIESVLQEAMNPLAWRLSNPDAKKKKAKKTHAIPGTVI